MAVWIQTMMNEVTTLLSSDIGINVGIVRDAGFRQIVASRIKFGRALVAVEVI